ncbi:MAG: AAA family ATPase [Deltaproteobacteria bacterium]|nr:AAA family ATPase [Deltaproteobacteria bacterium]
MYLRNVKVRNFRSFWSESAKPAVDIELARGVNYIAGPNNVGKSNLLRALAMALDPRAYPYDANLDRPMGWRADTQSTVVLEFRTQPDTRGPIGTLLKYVAAYEETVSGFKAPSAASQGRITFYVEHVKDTRKELFLANGAGAIKGDARALEKALAQFRRVVRFVDIRSGEDLRSLLQRGFKEILGSVIGEEHGPAMVEAGKCRDAYVTALGHVLRPVARHVQERIAKYVRDVQDVDLRPDVPSVEDAIAGARVHVQDAVWTALDQKGTGVRGATLLMLLSFIAESSRKAVVFAIEEPESFLHPEAHRELGHGLEEFTKRTDVSLVVTTHSPFLFRADGRGRNKLFTVRKVTEGRSSVGEERPEVARTELLGSQVFARFLQRADELSGKARLVLVVEGHTDRQYLQLAAEKTGLSLAGIDILPCEGAMDAAFQAVTLRGLIDPSTSVSALFDGDENGDKSARLLTSKGWQNKSQVLCYRQWVDPHNQPVEAEDMFPTAVLERFLAEVGESGHLSGKNQRGKTTEWHVELTALGKDAFLAWLGRNADADAFTRWSALIGKLRELAARAGEAGSQRTGD